MSSGREQRIGEICILTQTVLWSLFPIVAIHTFSHVTPLWTAAIGTLISSLFFSAVVTLKRSWGQWRHAPWTDILIATVMIAVVYYAIKYLGLRHTTAGNAALLAPAEILFSFLILGTLLRNERIVAGHVLGAVCMVLGVLLVLLPKASGWNTGDVLIVVSTMFPPIGNMHAKRALRRASPEFIMAVRSSIGGLALLLIACVLEPVPAAGGLLAAWPSLAVNGFLLLGFAKLLWMEGTRRLPVTKAVSLGNIAPVFTLGFASFLLGERVQWYQIAALIPILAGVFLLTRQTKIAIQT